MIRRVRARERPDPGFLARQHERGLHDAAYLSRADGDMPEGAPLETPVPFGCRCP